MDGDLRTLRERLAEISDLNRAAGVLGWDQRVMMPPLGTPARAEAMATLGKAAVPFRIVLTKADLVRRSELDDLVAELVARLRLTPAAMPEPVVTSTRDRRGLDELRSELAGIAAAPRGARAAEPQARGAPAGEPK